MFSANQLLPFSSLNLVKIFWTFNKLHSSTKNTAFLAWHTVVMQQGSLEEARTSASPRRLWSVHAEA